MRHQTLQNVLILCIMCALFIPTMAVLGFMGACAYDAGHYAMATAAGGIALFMVYAFIIILNEVLR